MADSASEISTTKMHCLASSRRSDSGEQWIGGAPAGGISRVLTSFHLLLDTLSAQRIIFSFLINTQKTHGNKKISGVMTAGCQ